VGKRGPPKTPTKILELRGSPKAQERVGEPTPPAGAVEMPTWLDAAARAKWQEVAPILAATGVLTVADVDTLAEYCFFWAKREEATKFIRENGGTHLVYDGRDKVKGMKPYPQVWQELKYADKCERLRAKLGMDPASRANLGAGLPPEPEQRDRARFFNTA